MNVDKIVKDRQQLEYIVDNCKFETPQQVAELFEAYTHLIWKYKQVGRIYDFYYDGMVIHREGGEDIIGVDEVIKHTLELLVAFPDLEHIFYDICCVGNQEDGYLFGQAVCMTGTYSGISKYGIGNGEKAVPHECPDLCQCLVKKIDGRWRVVVEWGVSSVDRVDRILRTGSWNRDSATPVTEAAASVEGENCVSG